MPRHIPGPQDPSEMEEFLSTFLYDDASFLIDEIVSLDRARSEIVARLDTTRPFPYVTHQRSGPGHPAHLSVGELIMATAHMGSLHGWFYHGLRWADGWVGYGNRIHRADFKALALIGPSLTLRSREIASRRGAQRIVARFEFEFSQNGQMVYYGDQTAMFLKSGDGQTRRT